MGIFLCLMLFLYQVKEDEFLVWILCREPFGASCLPPSVMDCERQSKFSIGCRVILPPDSFLTIRLPFVYGVQREDTKICNHSSPRTSA
ncbi:hypothetical protein Scep_005221 [Stephania cephalantha]|uniref:Secreted protein n=1 Tax=Stephania cephalantha TaxID=152367 RepID=A0AAP0PW60_9MAGN